ncbi:MAG: DNA double-strand break repair nuclease NurA [Promethearchaeia archaeon]
MNSQMNFNLNHIENLTEIIKNQVKKFNELRKLIRNLKFIPVDPIGSYSSVTYKSIDGGMMGISFHPFEFDFIMIADSMENELLRFLIPKSDSLNPEDFLFMDKFSQVQTLLKILGIKSIIEVSDLLKNSKIAMELTEYACIFDRISKDLNEPIIIMKDGLLRTKAINYQYLPKIISFLKENKKRKLVGVAKSSQVLNLISTALYVEGIIPNDYTGFIEIPWEIERLAYKRSMKETHLNYSLGKLYVAKLSKFNNLLVTIEIPYDFENNKEIYSRKEIFEIIGHLIKDSQGSYPILGYPQTIMRAHEKAVRTGFSASIWHDKIINHLIDKLGDKNIKKLILEGQILREYVKKDILGGI